VRTSTLWFSLGSPREAVEKARFAGATGSHDEKDFAWESKAAHLVQDLLRAVLNLDFKGDVAEIDAHSLLLPARLDISSSIGHLNCLLLRVGWEMTNLPSAAYPTLCVHFQSCYQCKYEEKQQRLRCTSRKRVPKMTPK